MSGIYGQALLSFPELLETFTVFTMEAAVNGGFTKTGDEKTIQGLYQQTKKKALTDSNGTVSYSSGLQLWTDESSLVGSFTQIRGDIYRITACGAWDNQGGFFVYDLEKVIGNNGTQSDDTTWNTGRRFFS